MRRAKCVRIDVTFEDFDSILLMGDETTAEIECAVKRIVSKWDPSIATIADYKWTIESYTVTDDD